TRSRSIAARVYRGARRTASTGQSTRETRTHMVGSARRPGRDREPHSIMTAKDAADLVETLERAGIDVWLDGGWGVDALFGEQTREHDDLDLLVRLEDVPALLAVLAGRGYEL